MTTIIIVVIITEQTQAVARKQINTPTNLKRAFFI